MTFSLPGSQKSRVQRVYTPRDQNITLAKTWFLRILHPVTTQVHRKKAKNLVIFKFNKWLFKQRMEIISFNKWLFKQRMEKVEIYASFQKFLWKLQFLSELCNERSQRTRHVQSTLHSPLIRQQGTRSRKQKLSSCESNFTTCRLKTLLRY